MKFGIRNKCIMLIVLVILNTVLTGSRKRYKKRREGDGKDAAGVAINAQSVILNYLLLGRVSNTIKLLKLSKSA